MSKLEEPTELRSARPTATTLLHPAPAAAFHQDVPPDPTFDMRYEAREELGTGGMGRVVLQRDARFGREVAMKVVRSDKMYGDIPDRFLREAQLQGRLEHPSIVPVYDLGRTSTGELYFTMKRVHGETLESIVRHLRLPDAKIVGAYGRQKLLAAFDQVCLATDYAHNKGVLHRDLKPANVMLGDFGEVYVLDWGIAREVKIVDLDAVHEVGLTGTPGYLAPEQIRGHADRRSDIYALGAILFEMLALEPLHRPDKVGGLLQATLNGVDVLARAREVGADLPPELETICIKATALNPDDRYATAHELHLALQGYLEGDRDLAFRQKLAAEHARVAEEIVPGESSDVARARAMAEAGRALALDPHNARAAATIARLLLEPPEELPRQVVEDLEELDTRTGRNAARTAALSYSGWLFAVPIFLWAGVREPISMLLMLSASAAAVATALWAASRREMGTATIYLSMTFALIAMIATARIFGPIILVPVLVVVNALPVVVIRPMSPVPWWIVTGMGFLAFVISLILEWGAFFPPSYLFAGGTLQVLPRMISIEPASFWALLVLGTIFATFGPAASLNGTRQEIVDVQRRLALQAWHLKQLVPRA